MVMITSLIQHVHKMQKFTSTHAHTKKQKKTIICITLASITSNRSKLCKSQPPLRGVVTNLHNITSANSDSGGGGGGTNWWSPCIEQHTNDKNDNAHNKTSRQGGCCPNVGKRKGEYINREGHCKYKHTFHHQAVNKANNHFQKIYYQLSHVFTTSIS